MLICVINIKTKVLDSQAALRIKFSDSLKKAIFAGIN